MSTSVPLIQKFSDADSMNYRIDVLAPVINRLISCFYDGTLSIGVEAFQDDLLTRISAAGCSETNWIDPMKVGVHPENREAAGLLPIDVHDLLLIICRNGWVWGKADLLGTRIPSTDVGEQWRSFNETLAMDSDGLLPNVNKSALEVVTVRGSHTTAAIRCLKASNTKGLHPELCGTDGFISRTKVIAGQPTMALPLAEQGLPYKLIHPALVQACPDLMKALSRTGNASHGVHREETTLQGCKRMHELIANHTDGSKEYIVKLACLGQLPGYATKAECYYDFCMAWSGGRDAHVLLALEAYERTLPVKRQLLASDLQKMAQLDLIEMPRYIPAIVKAMLNAPSDMVENGYAAVFSLADFMSMKPGGRHRANVAEANKIMDAAATFIKAYASPSLPAVQVRILLAKMEINCVMHVHGKTTPTRSSYDNLLQIAHEFYKSCKELDPNLPVWKDVVGVKEKESKTTEEAKGQTFRETRDDNAVPDEELARLGLVTGCVIAKKPDKSDGKPKHKMKYKLYRIGAVGTPEDDNIELTEIMPVGQEDDAMVLSFTRTQVILGFNTHNASTEEVGNSDVAISLFLDRWIM